jgi:hypothetical protein
VGQWFSNSAPWNPKFLFFGGTGLLSRQVLLRLEPLYQPPKGFLCKGSGGHPGGSYQLLRVLYTLIFYMTPSTLKYKTLERRAQVFGQTHSVHPWLLLLFFFFFFFFCTGVRTQGLMFTRQALYHLSLPTSPPTPFLKPFKLECNKKYSKGTQI